MTLFLGTIPASTTMYIPFATYDGATGASETCSGLAVTDIEIYKNGSTTQRASDAGYTLLDTDGIDFDGITGINGFSVDLSDNTDAGFYAVGSWYWVVVSSITADAQTVNFIAAVFRIGPAEATAGYQAVDAAKINNVSTSSVTNVYAHVGATAAPGAANGVLIAGSNAATTFASATVTNALTTGSIVNNGATTLTGAITLTGAVSATNPSNDINGCNVQKIDDQNVTASGGITVPTSIASPTNITSGTITTVTNLTNAPTNGDFTPVMKSSITTAATSSTPTVTLANGAHGGAAATITLQTPVDANVETINTSSNAATRLALSAAQIIPGTVDTGSFAATTTQFEADDIAEATADHYNGRIIIFTTGALAGQATDITDYALSGANGHFTVTAMTEAPANNDTFVIV